MITIEIGSNLAVTLTLISLFFTVAWSRRSKWRK